jgi:hypothetical protein
MNPYPLEVLNHLTVPFSIGTSPCNSFSKTPAVTRQTVQPHL